MVPLAFPCTPVCAPPLARTTRVSRRFGAAIAVDGVDLEVAGSEVVGLLGANGAGKTTLIRMLLGLLRPSSGTVELFGLAPSRATRRRLGYVPQGLGLYADLTVQENLSFAAAAFGEGPPGSDHDLASVAGELVGELPLGLQRRLAFLQALAHFPDLLVLDEPTSGVDPLGRARLWDGIRQAAEDGAGVLVTTHNIEEAEQCDRLVIMVAGRVAVSGTIETIVGESTVVEVRAPAWPEAFSALDRAGLTVGLRGAVLRVPSASPAQVRAALRRAGVPADLREARATLEEAFVVIASGPAGRLGQMGVRREEPPVA